MLALLFEEWDWEPRARAFAALSRLPFWAKLEVFISRLPPWAASLTLALPGLTLIPIKQLALCLLRHARLFSRLTLVMAATISGTTAAARLFLRTLFGWGDQELEGMLTKFRSHELKVNIA